jgi:hypothetical protein
MGKGNGVRPVFVARDADTRLAAAYRVLMALVFVGAFLFLFATGTREKRGSKN